MSIRLGDFAPNFTADTTKGMINFYEWIGNDWALLLSHPKGFTPACTTEILWLYNNFDEFKKRNIKVLNLAVDKLILIAQWYDNLKAKMNLELQMPIIADKSMRIAKLYGMLHNRNGLAETTRLATDEATTIRSAYIISPDKRINAVLNYPVCTGRNFLEILRIMDSFIITSKNTISTPANWSLGDDLIAVSHDELDNKSDLPTLVKSSKIIDIHNNQISESQVA